jgi:hypothetical protein
MVTDERTSIQVDPDTRELLRQASAGTNDSERIQNLVRQVDAASFESRKTKQVVVKAEGVEPGTRVRFRERAPIDGGINSLVFFFPSGPDFNVDVAVDVDDDRLVPGAGDFLALDDATVVVPVQERVNVSDPIDLIVRNRDPQEAHTIEILANVVQNLSIQSNDVPEVR